MDEKKFKNLSFNDMPQAVEFLIDRILSMSEQIGVISEQIGHAIPDQWMTIDDLSICQIVLLPKLFILG